MDMTVQQFRDWAHAAQFTVTDHIDGHSADRVRVGLDEHGDDVLAPRAYAYVWRTAAATLPSGDPVEITFQRQIEWAGSARERIKDGWTAPDDEGCEPWVIEGNLTLLDDEGDRLLPVERDDALADVMGASNPAFDITDIDYEGVLPPVVTEDIDLSEGVDMETIVVSRDNDTDLRFTGEQIATVSSSAERARSDFSGSTGRWTVLKLYKTKGGKFVAQQIGHTQRQGEHTRYSAAVCATPEEVVAFFGQGWLAKELYEAAGVDACEDVE